MNKGKNVNFNHYLSIEIILMDSKSISKYELQINESDYKIMFLILQRLLKNN